VGTIMSRQVNFKYLMEREDESIRLVRKDRSHATVTQLIDTGIRELGENPHIVDAGSGAGVVAMWMADITSQVQNDVTISLLDGSTERLATAEKNLLPYSSVRKQFINCNLEEIPLPDDNVDYLFCRFVFEYLENPMKVFKEFQRIVKPGGKVVIGDLDNNSINHFPLPSDLQFQLDELVNEIENKKLLDFHAGRKLYSYFYENKFEAIKAHIYGHHLFYGELDDNDEHNWSTKLDQMIRYQDSGELVLEFDLRKFKSQFMGFLKSPARFSYTPLIIIEGVKRL
jgi:ubiquinone/menaquinone biosynthesis C-methylase UbiE